MIRALGAGLVLWIYSSAAHAVECRDLDHGDLAYTVCEVNLDQDTLRLFLNGADGAPYGQFSQIDRTLQSQGLQLGFATNAGMYHDDRSPVGLYIEDGLEVMRVMPNAGPGNFGLLPNGVLCLRDTRADVIETLRYIDREPDCRSATQSGPMLVIDGALHPRFLKDGTSRYVRNGVGTSADGKRAVFVISNAPVTFYEFGTVFKEALDLPNALYFDGNISRLHAPSVGRSDLGFSLGPIIGTVQAAE